MVDVPLDVHICVLYILSYSFKDTIFNFCYIYSNTNFYLLFVNIFNNILIQLLGKTIGICVNDIYIYIYSVQSIIKIINKS